MNTSRLLISALVVAIVALVSDFILHGSILAGAYSAHPELMGTEEQMSKWFWLYIIGNIGLGLLLSYVFIKGYEGKGVGEGFRFGLLIGLLIWVPTFTIFVTFMPYPKIIDILQPLWGVLQFVVYGILISLIYKPQAAAATAA